MDKNTLSNYGWVVCVILVLAIMISLATPFGSVIRDKVARTVTNFRDNANGVLDNMGGASSFGDLGGGAGNAGGMGGGSGAVTLGGHGQTFHAFAPAALSFKSPVAVDTFKEVQVDSETVEDTNYTMSEQNTVVTFKIPYLETLDKGIHEVTLVTEGVSPKGSFTVEIPETNEHGFYYNQPYTAFISFYGENESFFIREDGTLDIIATPSGQTHTATYTVDGNNMTVVSPVAGTLTGTFSDDGMSVYCNEFASTFTLGNDAIVADEEYLYAYIDELGGYQVSVIDKTKSHYNPIKTGINGKPTVKLAEWMFRGCTSLVQAPVIPDSVTCIGYRAFEDCVNLTSINLPAGLTTVGDYAFYGCSNLINVTSPCTCYEQLVFDAGVDCGSIAIYHFDGCGHGAAPCGIEGHLIGDGLDHTSTHGEHQKCQCAGWVIPEGGIYTMKKAVNGKSVYNAGEQLPCGYVASANDNYQYGDYIYRYYTPSNGWRVEINTAVTDRNQTTYGPILESINGEHITSINSTFANCQSLTTAPVIPSGVWDMMHAFSGCASLTVAPAIPNGVRDMTGAFDDCSSLTIAPVIPSSVETMSSTFWGCTSLTTAPDLSNCTQLTSLQATFSDCISLKTYVGSADADGDFSNYVIPNSVTNVSSMFGRCTSITAYPNFGT